MAEFNALLADVLGATLLVSAIAITIALAWKFVLFTLEDWG